MLPYDGLLMAFVLGIFVGIQILKFGFLGMALKKPNWVLLKITRSIDKVHGQGYSRFLMRWEFNLPQRHAFHHARQTQYKIVGDGRLQTDKPIADNAAVTVYEDLQGGIWVRPVGEMTDGRFTIIAEPYSRWGYKNDKPQVQTGRKG